MFKYKRKIKLQDTDAAGVLFFASQFHIFHEAFESFMEEIGLNIGTIIHNRKYLLPIVHLESDYKIPLFAGDTVVIQLVIEHIGESSFTIKSDFLKNGKICAGIVKTVHVSVDGKTRKKIPLPKEVRDKIAKHPTLST